MDQHNVYPYRIFDDRSRLIAERQMEKLKRILG